MVEKNNILDTLPDKGSSDILDTLPDEIEPGQAPGPDPALEAEGNSVMKDAWRTAQDIGNVYPVAEAAAHIITNLYGLPITGFAGLLGLVGGADTSTKWMDFTSDLLIYKPQTPGGQRTTQSALYPFELLSKGGQQIADITEKAGAPWYVNASVKTLIEGAPALVGLRHLPKAGQALYTKITKSEPWRMATIKERGLVVQSIEEVLKKNPELTEAELARKSQNHFEQSLERVRAKKAQETKQTQEAAQKMGKEVKETAPVVEEGSPQVNQIFKEVTEPKKAIGKKRIAEKEPEVIVAAAIKLKDGRVFTGASHHIAMEAMDHAGIPVGDFRKVVEDADGFATSQGNYITRAEAVKITEEPSEDAADIIGHEIPGKGLPQEPPIELTAKQAIRPEDITEYEQLAGEAARRAEAKIAKEFLTEDKAALASSRKLARDYADQDPAISKMTDAIDRGGISRQSLIDAGAGKEAVAALGKKRRGLVKKDGELHADRLAEEHGFGTVDEMVQDWLDRPTKQEVIKRIAAEDYEIYESSIDEARDIVMRERVLNEEIEILQKMLSKRNPTTNRELKRVIREQTGQKKVKDLVSVDERQGLKTQIKLEAKAAREAFSAGKKEATLKHKLRQRELLIKQRVNKLQRDTINKIVKDLKAIKTAKMSPQAAGPIKELLSDIDLARISKKKELQLESLRRHLEENPDTELAADRFKELTRLDKWNLKDIAFDDLVTIHEAVMHYVHLEKLKRKIKVGRERKRATTVVNDSVSEMKPAEDISSDIVTSQQGGKPVKTTGKLLKDTFGIRHDHYDLVVETLAGPNSTMDKVLYQGVKEGITKQYDYRQKAFDKFRKDIDPVVKKVSNVGVWLGEVVKTGKFELTRNERMALYRHSLSEDNLAAILKGGFGFKRSKTPERIYKITAEELGEIIKSLTPEELSFAGKPVDNLFKNQSDALSDVFYEKNGYPLPVVENYYPKEVMPRSIGSSAKQEIALEQYKGKYVRVGLDKSMLIERVGSKLPISLNPLTTDLNNSVLKSAAYIGLEIPLSNASKLLYNPEFRAEMTSRYGDVTWREIEKGLRDIAGDYKGYTTVEELMMRAKNNLSTAVLGLNPFVMAKQVLSLPVYLPYIDAGFLAQGMGEYLLDPQGVTARHKLYSPEYVERVQGGFSRDVADVFKAGSERRLYGGRKKLKEFGMSGIKIFDEAAVASGMQGGVLMVLDQFKKGKLSEQVRVALDITDADIPKLSPADKMRLAYRYVDYATERTQPMFSPEHLSSLQRGSTTEKLFTMFGSFTNQALNIIRRASRDYARAKTEAQKASAATKIAKVLFAVAVLNPLGVMAIDTIRDKLYGREKTGTFLGRLASSYSSYVFFLRDIMNSLVSKLERGTYRGYDVDVPVMMVPNLLVDSISNGYEALYSTKKHGKAKASKRFVDNSLRLIFTMNGIPYSTPKKIVAATIEKGKSSAKKSRQEN